jgi:hypothetical protein
MGTLIQTTAVALAMLSYLPVAEAQTVFAGNVSCWLMDDLSTIGDCVRPRTIGTGIRQRQECAARM